MCRSARFGFNSCRSIRRLKELGEMPPRYRHASFNFKAPLLTGVVLLNVSQMGGCVISFVFISVGEQISSYFLSIILLR